MRHPPEVMLVTAISTFALTGVVALALYRDHDVGRVDPSVLIEPQLVTGPTPDGVGAPAATWFGRVRAFCNPVEVDSRMRVEPPPASPEGAMHEAACYALAGKIDRARELIVGLDEESRFRAAGVVFQAGHPAADAGDDVAAGPLMELVVEFWPNHYMALYHAGAARFDLGDYDAARVYLDRFMIEYATEDAWRASGRAMLERIAEEG